jgi:hypothetical protein
MLSLKLVDQYESPRPRVSLVALNRKDGGRDLMINNLLRWDDEPTHHSNLRTGAERVGIRYGQSFLGVILLNHRPPLPKADCDLGVS